MKDPVSEQVVIRSLLAGDMECFEEVTKHVPEIFGTRPGKVIYKAILELQTQNQALPRLEDLRLLLRNRYSTSESEYKLLLDYLLQITQKDLPENPKSFIETLENGRRCRILAERSLEISEIAEAGDSSRACSMMQNTLDFVSGGDQEEPFVDMASPDSFDDLEFVEAPLPEGHMIPSGYEAHDSEIGGFFRRQCVVIAAKRGDGKSAFVLNLAKNFYLQGHNIALFPLENSRQETRERMLAMIAEVSYQRIQEHTITDTDRWKLRIARFLFALDSECWGKAREFMMKMGDRLFKESLGVISPEIFERFPKRENKLLISDSVGWPLARICTALRRMADSGRLDVSIVDPMNVAVEVERTGNEKTHEMLGKGAYRLKDIADATKHLAFFTAQLSDENRTKYSRQIEDAVDRMLMWDLTVEDRERNVVPMRYTKSRSSKMINFDLKINLDNMIFMNNLMGAPMNHQIPYRVLDDSPRLTEGGELPMNMPKRKIEVSSAPLDQQIGQDEMYDI